MLPVAFIIGLTLIMSAFLYHEVMEREEDNCWQTLEDSANSVTREMQITFQNDINTLHRQQTHEKTSVVYLDLNGLKEINDKYGHEAGDALICNAAQIISQIYPEEAYRVGGDEFVILALNMEQQTFEEKLTTLQKQMQQKNISILAGILWEEKCNDLEALLKEADKRMYEDKQQYYQHKKKVKP